MIGIICAEKQELDEILKLMSNKSEEIFSFFEFIKGKINNQDCVVALSGVGKVSSAICAQTLILKYCPNFILNVGVAGGIAENINIFDTVIANNVVQHDFDVSAFPNRKKGEIPALNLVQIPCSPWIIKNISSIIKNTVKNIKIHYGTVVSGDQFINSPTKLIQLNNYFCGIACDMESGAIGQTCLLNKIDFGIIRSISDNANSSAKVNFGKFIIKASVNACNILSEFLKTI